MQLPPNATPKEVAATCGVLIDTVYEWVRQRSIQFRRIGPRGRIAILVDRYGWPLSTPDDESTSRSA